VLGQPPVRSLDFRHEHMALVAKRLYPIQVMPAVHGVVASISEGLDVVDLEVVVSLGSHSSTAYTPEAVSTNRRIAY
jgi:hypothetical protein